MLANRNLGGQSFLFAIGWLFWWLLVLEFRAFPCDDMRLSYPCIVFISFHLYENMQRRATSCKSIKPDSKPAEGDFMGVRFPPPGTTSLIR
jgi:hypothetical protein